MKKISLFLCVLMTITGFMLGNPETELSEYLDHETIDNIMRSLWLYRGGNYLSEELSEEIITNLLSAKNQNESYTQRMQHRLTWMMNNPDYFTPDYTQRYTTFLDYATSLSPQKAYVLTQFLGLDSNKGYEEVPRVGYLYIPKDHAPQFGFQVGWHFFVGNCVDEEGNEYGIQLMFWRYSLLPSQMARYFDLTDIENQVIEMHFAISRAGDRHYRSKPIVVGGTTGLVEFKSNPFTYVMGNNAIFALQEDDFTPLRLSAKGWDKSHEHEVEIEIGITIEQMKKVVLNGNQGALPSVGGVGTLYYSITNLKMIPGDSYLVIDGEKIDLVEGKFWFDHQWANGLSPEGNPRDLLVRMVKTQSGPEPSGWDWFMVQFDNETEIGMSAMHTLENTPFYFQTGINAPGVMTAAVTGIFVDEEGNSTDQNGVMIVSEWVKSIYSPYPELYWVTDTWYPNSWEFRFEGEGVPENIKHFFLKPIVEGGQSGFFAAGAQYSEGGVDTFDSAGNIIGKGFAESVSYANTIENMLAIVGLPNNEDIRQALEEPSISGFDSLIVDLYLAWPENQKKLMKLLSDMQ
ncbi:MAG: hypothetical protein JW697_08345 [Kosmotogaceae bacterium]|nr:hypothetical protein [Kosmotogaceae bacterium]